MTEALCQDALGGDFLFQDWDIERDFVSKLVAFLAIHCCLILVKCVSLIHLNRLIHQSL